MRGALAALVAAAQGADPANINLDGPNTAVMIKLAKASPVARLKERDLANCDMAVLAVPVGVRQEFEAALVRTCSLMNAVPGIPDFAFKALTFLIKFSLGA